jgi:hypothetical protein
VPGGAGETRHVRGWRAVESSLRSVAARVGIPALERVSGQVSGRSWWSACLACEADGRGEDFVGQLGEEILLVLIRVSDLQAERDALAAGPAPFAAGLELQDVRQAYYAVTAVR